VCVSCEIRRFGGTWRIHVRNNPRARSSIAAGYQIRSSETSMLTRLTRCNITEDDYLHSHRRKSIKSYIALTGWSLLRRRNVSPVTYELGFYIPEDDILHSHRRENFKSYVALTGLAM
jgi:hypothetical protein